MLRYALIGVDWGDDGGTSRSAYFGGDEKRDLASVRRICGLRGCSLRWLSSQFDASENHQETRNYSTSRILPIHETHNHATEVPPWRFAGAIYRLRPQG
jgi:hypothetical protein